METSNKLQQRLKSSQSLEILKCFVPLAIAVPICFHLAEIRLFVQNQFHEDDYTQVSRNQHQQIKPLTVFTVVTVENPTTLFHQDGFTHGFGYALLRQFADQMQLQLDLKTVKDEATALKWVQLGKAQMALSTVPVDRIHASGLHAVASSCGVPADIENFGLNAQLSMVFQSEKNTLAEAARSYACHAQQSGTTQNLAQFYAQNYLSHADLMSVTRDLQNKLPSYKASFQRSADFHDLDWEFLVAIGYQESYLNPSSVSPTGVKGVMMLTENTAKAMGVADRNNPTQSIDGGAKYMNHMLEAFADIPQPDRNWFALAAYNMGVNHINRIRSALRQKGQNPDQWLNVYRYLQEQQNSQPRYKQALQYVTRIRVYLEHIKTAQIASV